MPLNTGGAFVVLLHLYLYGGALAKNASFFDATVKMRAGSRIPGQIIPTRLELSVYSCPASSTNTAVVRPGTTRVPSARALANFTRSSPLERCTG